MRRVLAACCFVWFATKLIAVYLPPAALGLLAAVFVCVFWCALALGKRNYSFLLPLVGLTAIFLHSLMYDTVVAPAFALAGQEVEAVVLTEQVDPGFQDGTVRGEFTVLELNGKSLPVWKRFRISAVAMPECERADLLRGTFSVELLEEDEYYYGNLADGVLLQATTAEDVTLEGQSRAPRFFLRQLQETLARNCRRYLAPELGSVLAAMAVGDKSRLTNEITDAYRAAGVSHLLVVSGLHLTLLCGAFLGNRPCSGRFRRQKALAAMVLVVGMMALVGFTPSVTRAGIGALIFYTGALFLQPADSFTSLGVAAVLLSLQNCYAVCDLGLQLSFAATLGVLCAARIFPPMRLSEQEEHPWRCRIRQGCTVLLVPLLATRPFGQRRFRTDQLAGNAPGGAYCLSGPDLCSDRTCSGLVPHHPRSDASGGTSGKAAERHCILHFVASGCAAGAAQGIHGVCRACLRGSPLVCLEKASPSLGASGSVRRAGGVLWAFQPAGTGRNHDSPGGQHIQSLRGDNSTAACNGAVSGRRKQPSAGTSGAGSAGLGRGGTLGGPAPEFREPERFRKTAFRRRAPGKRTMDREFLRDKTFTGQSEWCQSGSYGD